MMEEPNYGVPKRSKFQIFAEQRLNAIKLAKSAARTAKDIANNPKLADDETVHLQGQNVLSTSGDTNTLD